MSVYGVIFAAIAKKVSALVSEIRALVSEAKAVALSITVKAENDAKAIFAEAKQKNKALEAELVEKISKL
jgi:hypothetical protein